MRYCPERERIFIIYFSLSPPLFFFFKGEVPFECVGIDYLSVGLSYDGEQGQVRGSVGDDDLVLFPSKGVHTRRNLGQTWFFFFFFDQALNLLSVNKKQGHHRFFGVDNQCDLRRPFIPTVGAPGSGPLGDPSCCRMFFFKSSTLFSLHKWS